MLKLILFQIGNVSTLKLREKSTKIYSSVNVFYKLEKRLLEWVEWAEWID